MGQITFVGSILVGEDIRKLPHSFLSRERRTCSTPRRMEVMMGHMRMHIFMLTFFLWYAHDLRMSAFTWNPCTCTPTHTCYATFRLSSRCKQFAHIVSCMLHAFCLELDATSALTVTYTLLMGAADSVQCVSGRSGIADFCLGPPPIPW